ncbi:MAG: ribonuclease III [Panacagrimonas sp.]
MVAGADLSSQHSSLLALCETLGYRFEDEALLQQALTHRSAASQNNERLEFLGDALINLVIAQGLFERAPQTDEGGLSRLRASLVCESSLAGLARQIDLGSLLCLGEGERKSGGWRRASVLADAFEAVLGAILLDGGFEAARDVALKLFDQLLADLPDAEQLKDAKTRLQEHLQAQSRPLPVYEVLSESGPAHRRHFVVRCALEDDQQLAEASGSSRRGAEQSAARQMLGQLLGEQTQANSNA